MADTRLRILCIGNLLHGNDSVGYRVYSALCRASLPGSVDLIDGGTGGLTLLPLFKGVPQVLLVDCVKSTAPEGSVALYPDIGRGWPADYADNALHGGSMATLLAMLPVYIKTPPRVDLLCVSARSLEHFSVRTDFDAGEVVDALCARVLDYVSALNTQTTEQTKKEKTS
ncbi:hydrogenase maturation protease [Alteromonas sp. CYL-A6]|uniref:hydrogenase maturation protease n=1 Tax=Alteromonas nitratireducens TaxID=3390813 RepID=UPI0034B5C3E1